MIPEQQQRIAELEDALKEKERRLQDLKTDLDKTNNLIERQAEQMRDCNDVIQSWIEGFGMTLDATGKWQWDSFILSADDWHNRYVDLLRQWNCFVPEYNATVRRRNVGRPLAAGDGQVTAVLKLRKARKSLRAIAEETGLGLNTVRTIVDQGDQRDRTTLKHLERIRRDMGEDRTWQSRKRTRAALPRRINAALEQGATLGKEAKDIIGGSSR
jgi:hypothetical protein